MTLLLPLYLPFQVIPMGLSEFASSTFLSSTYLYTYSHFKKKDNPETIKNPPNPQRTKESAARQDCPLTSYKTMHLEDVLLKQVRLWSGVKKMECEGN